METNETIWQLGKELFSLKTIDPKYYILVESSISGYYYSLTLNDCKSLSYKNMSTIIYLIRWFFKIQSKDKVMFS